MRENIYDSGQPQEPAVPEPPPRKPRPTRNWNAPGWRWARRIGVVVVIILGLAPYVVSRIFDHVVMTTPAPESLTLFWIGDRQTILARCLTATSVVIGLVVFWLVSPRLRMGLRCSVVAGVVMIILPLKMTFDEEVQGRQVTLMASIDVAGGRASVRHYCFEYCPFICKNRSMQPVIVVEDRRVGKSARAVEFVDWRAEVPGAGLCGRLQANKSDDVAVRLTARPGDCSNHTKQEDDEDLAAGLGRYSTITTTHIERGYKVDWCRPQWPVVRPIWPVPAAKR